MLKFLMLNIYKLTNGTYVSQGVGGNAYELSTGGSQVALVKLNGAG